MNSTEILSTFVHRQAAHCESGVMSSLLHHSGAAISEPLAFGLASALAFAYLPFIKVGGLPLVAYRLPPGALVQGLQKPLRFKMQTEKFRDPQAGQARLDELLAQGKLVGLQVGVYWLPYFPPDLRFHFNAHNLLVFGRGATGDYLISDPVFETAVTCAAPDLQRARFARGVLAPHGRLYFPATPPQLPVDIAGWRKVLMPALRRTCRLMCTPWLPIAGTGGMRTLALRFARLPADDSGKTLIGHVVRMQEEIGTGGGGFRYLYAAFLNEAADLADWPTWREQAEQLLDIADGWREFALRVARMIRDREAFSGNTLAELLRRQAKREEALFRQLRQTLIAS